MLFRSGNQMVEQMLLERQKLPEAIACANDCMAIGVCSALTEHGIKVPDDIAVIGYDSIQEGRYSPVPLTSAEIPAKSCGKYSRPALKVCLSLYFQYSKIVIFYKCRK